MGIMELKITVNGTAYAVEVEKIGNGVTAPTMTKVAAPSVIASPPTVTPPAAVPPSSAVAVSAGEIAIKAPMPGKVIKISARVGDKVAKGDVLMFLEAMKMQNEIAAAANGTIKSICVNNDDNVKPGQVLVVLGA